VQTSEGHGEIRLALIPTPLPPGRTARYAEKTLTKQEIKVLVQRLVQYL
jgi:hypothetical protein